MIKSVIEFGPPIEKIIIGVIQILSVLALFLTYRQIGCGSEESLAVIVAKSHNFLSDGECLSALLSFGPGEAERLTYVFLGGKNVMVLNSKCAASSGTRVDIFLLFIIVLENHKLLTLILSMFFITEHNLGLLNISYAATSMRNLTILRAKLSFMIKVFGTLSALGQILKFDFVVIQFGSASFLLGAGDIARTLAHRK